MTTPRPWFQGTWGGRCKKEHGSRDHPGPPDCLYEPIRYDATTIVRADDAVGDVAWCDLYIAAEIPGVNVIAPGGDDGLEARVEDIAFIVRAVNAHDGLVAALELARVNLMAWNSSGLAPWEAKEMNTLYEASPEIQAIDAALRAAKGEGS